MYGTKTELLGNDSFQHMSYNHVRISFSVGNFLYIIMYIHYACYIIEKEPKHFNNMNSR